MRTELVICDKKYKPKEITFGVGLQLEELGVDIYTNFKPMKAIAGYVAVVTNCSLKEATELIDKHIADGGDLEEITSCFYEAMEESGFFQPKAKKTTKK